VLGSHQAKRLDSLSCNSLRFATHALTSNFLY
jgi:hypothetical protein